MNYIQAIRKTKKPQSVLVPIPDDIYNEISLIQTDDTFKDRWLHVVYEIEDMLLYDYKNEISGKRYILISEDGGATWCNLDNIFNCVVSDDNTVGKEVLHCLVDNIDKLYPFDIMGFVRQPQTVSADN